MTTLKIETAPIRFDSIGYVSETEFVVRFELSQEGGIEPVILSELVRRPPKKAGMSYDQIVSTARSQLIERIKKATSFLQDIQRNYQHPV